MYEKIINKLKMVLIVLFSLVSVLAGFNSHAQEAGNAELFKYKNKFFLLDEWSPIKKDLYVISDPFCKFCITGLDKLKKFGSFNIFLIPSDIVSNNRAPNFLDEFYSCRFEKSKIMFQRKSEAPYFPHCEIRSEEEKEELIRQAHSITDLIKPQYVPFYYAEGVKDIREILLDDSTFSDKSTQQKTTLDWNRYDSFLVGDYRPDSTHVLLSNASIEINKLCEASKINCYSAEYCKSNEFMCQLKRQEWELLFNYTSGEEGYYFEGYSIEKHRMLIYLEFNK